MKRMKTASAPQPLWWPVRILLGLIFLILLLAYFLPVLVKDAFRLWCDVYKNKRVANKLEK